MSVYGGPEIVSNGLVFGYDMGNTKSWKGAPVTNEAKNVSNQIDWVIGNLDQAVSRSEIVPNESYYISSSSLTGTSFRIYFTNATLVNGSTYTVSYKYRIISGGPLFFANDWCDTGITRVTTDLGGGVFYETATGTRATYDVTFRFLDLQISNNTIVQIWDLQLELGSFATPYSSTRVRSNTQAILDSTGLNTVTATSLTYNSNNTFSFNGSTNHIITTNTGMSHGTDNFSYSCWVKFAGLPGLGTIFENGFYYAGILIRFQTNIIAIYAQYSTTSYVNSFSFTPTIGQWYNLVITRVGNNLLLYSNGILQSTITFGTSINVVPSNNLMYIGMSQHAAGQCFQGEIAHASVYSKALTSSEISQNFNALRSRFGV